MEKSRKLKNKEMSNMKYVIDGLTPELVKKAEKELGETDEVKAESLKELRCLIKGEPDLHACMEDKFLLRFLRSKKFKVEKAFKTLKNFYAHKATYSGILSDFLPSDIKLTFETDQMTPLQYRDSELTGIGLVRIGKIDFHKICTDDFLRCLLVLAEFGMDMESMAVSGYSVIIDFEGIGFHTFRKFANPTFLHRVFSAIQDVMPCRVKAYHIINEPIYFNVAVTIARSFMSEKLNSRFHVHGKNLKTLYEHVPQEILPEELGGKQGPIPQYLKEFKKQVYSKEDHYIKMRKFGYQGKTLLELQKGNAQAIVT